MAYFPSMSVRVDLPASTTSTPASMMGSPVDLSSTWPLMVPSCSAAGAASSAHAANDQARHARESRAAERQRIKPPCLGRSRETRPGPTPERGTSYDMDRFDFVTGRRRADARVRRYDGETTT